MFFKQVCVLALASAAQSAIVAPLGAGLPLTNGYGLGTPLAYVAAPAQVTPAITAPVYAAAPSHIASYQFQQQDELGNLRFGYSNINSARHESGNTYAGVHGSYSYIDPNGVLQTTNYVADALGFRAEASNLPVAPVANLQQPVHTLIGPEPVEKTAEVKAAEAEFLAAFKEAQEA